MEHGTVVDGNNYKRHPAPGQTRDLCMINHQNLIHTLQAVTAITSYCNMHQLRIFFPQISLRVAYES
jgi:hypothetical protein